MTAMSEPECVADTRMLNRRRADPTRGHDPNVEAQPVVGARSIRERVRSPYPGPADSPPGCVLAGAKRVRLVGLDGDQALPHRVMLRANPELTVIARPLQVGPHRMENRPRGRYTATASRGTWLFQWARGTSTWRSLTLSSADRADRCRRVLRLPFPPVRP